MNLKKYELLVQYQKTCQGWRSFLDIKLENSQLYKHADTTDGKFNYPIYRRRVKQNIGIMRKAEANLDAFCNAVDQHYRSEAASSQHDLVVHRLSGDRAIERTPAWREPEKKKRTAIEPSLEYVQRSFSTVYHDAAKQITGTFNRSDLTEPATKPKRRGNTTQVADTEPAPATADEVAQALQTYVVDKRTYKVFKSLFHSPFNPDQPGEVSWPDFLHTMITMGFSAEKLRRSAWNFAPHSIDLGIERSINFHEPHPSNKLPFVWARWNGRRLTKAYGWVGEMFRLV